LPPNCYKLRAEAGTQISMGKVHGHNGIPSGPECMAIVAPPLRPFTVLFQSHR